jgi:hypothetical protein
MIFSANVYDPHDPASAGFKDSMWELMKLGGTPNLSKFFPFLRFLDLQGLCRQTAKHFQGMYDFVDLFIQERLAPARESVEKTDSKKDFLDVLLDCRSEDFTVVDIRVLIAVSTEMTHFCFPIVDDISAGTFNYVSFFRSFSLPAPKRARQQLNGPWQSSFAILRN